ncbi:MAG: mismatch repair protein [Acidobacteriaceae bacterium]
MRLLAAWHGLQRVHNGRMGEGERAEVELGEPLKEYGRRLGVHEDRESRLKAQHLWLGVLRLAAVVGFVVVAWFTVFLKEGPPWTLVIPMVLFLVLGAWMGRVSRRLSTARRAAAMYRLGIARMEDRWVGLQEREVSAELSEDVRAKLAASLYASDLDIVGRGGVFELLCRARTRMGEERLLGWLLEPAPVAEILERQAAVEELRGRLDFKEKMGVAGETVAVGVQADALLKWAEAEDVLTEPWMPWVAGVLAVLAVVMVMIVIWVTAGGVLGGLTSASASAGLVAVLVIEWALRRPFEKKINAVLGKMDRAVRNMKLLAGLLEVMEQKQFSSERLEDVARKLRSHDVAGSVAIGKLATLGDWSDSMDNMIARVINLPLMYTVQVAWAAQRWRRRHGGAVRLWLEAVAEMEALLSLATFAYEHPQDVFPELVEGQPGARNATVEADEIGHPLIAAAKCVRNSLRMGGEARVLLITGSNMSGKSTLMRTLGVNTVLAMCGGTVRARRLRLTPLQIGASLLVNDSLQEGHSRFYAEIEKLGRICTLAESCAGGEVAGCGGYEVMFLLDELLQGTNSKDRLVGAEGVVRALVEAGAIGMVTTHDLALADMEGLPPDAMKKMHLQDQIVDGQMRFDFTLRDGVATRSNGVELMRLIGLKV